jgi:Uma2 family endonuclease
LLDLETLNIAERAHKRLFQNHTLILLGGAGFHQNHEYVDGRIFQKPMPKRKHSLLQSELCTAINAVAKPASIAYAFPELRCSFGNRSLVPDIAILDWENIEFDQDGIPLDDVFISQDWVIEILSPEQSSNRVTANIVHCLKFGCKLG